MLSSSYSHIGLLPISVLGLSFFLLMSYITAKTATQSKELIGFQTVVTGLGVLVSVYLMSIQFFVIKAFCIFCTASAGIILILFIISFFQYKQQDYTVFLPPRETLLPGSFFVALPLMLAVGIFILTQFYSVTFSAKHAVTSDYGPMSLSEVDDLIGLEYSSLQDKLYDLRHYAINTHIAKQDAKALGLSLNQYFRTFVENDLSISDTHTRQKLKTFRGNNSQLNAYLSVQKKIDKEQFRQRFEQLKKDVLTYTNTTINIKKDFLVKVKDNMFGGVQIGPDSAPITVDVFSDFQCSHCAKFHKNIEDLMEKHPDLLKVNFRHFAHASQMSKLAARASICADDQQKYGPVASYLYANQKTLSKKTIQEAIQKAKLNLDQFDQCMKSFLIGKIIKEDDKEVERLKFTGTPTVIVNQHVGNIKRIKQEIQTHLGGHHVH